MGLVELSSFSVGNFEKGAPFWKQTLWYFINALFVRASWNPFVGLKVWLLKLFGAKIGHNVYIKNNVIIKFPWKLKIGDNCWIGEYCWIDNIDYVSIGSNVCISQGALIITGNHDYTISNMPYRNAPIVIKDGAWIGAKAIVTAGVTIEENTVLTVGSIVTKDTIANGIYQGNPAIIIKKRIIK